VVEARPAFRAADMPTDFEAESFASQYTRILIISPNFGETGLPVRYSSLLKSASLPFVQVYYEAVKTRESHGINDFDYVGFLYNDVLEIWSVA
jgi:hypothetical protein